MCSDMNLALCGGETEQHSGWVNVPVGGGGGVAAELPAAPRSSEWGTSMLGMYLKGLQFLLFPPGVGVQAVGEGSHCIWCMRVSSSDYYPPPPLISFCLSASSSPPPLVCAFPPLLLTLGRGEQKLLHPMDGESSPTLLTHARRIYTIL